MYTSTLSVSKVGGSQACFHKAYGYHLYAPPKLCKLSVLECTDLQISTWCFYSQRVVQ